MKKLPLSLAGLFCAILLLASVTTIAACSAAEDDEPVRIVLMHGWGGSGQDHIAMRRIYDDFQKDNPDIVLVCDSSPDISVVIEKANNKLAADKMSDIISTNGHSGFVISAQKKGLALDLAPYIAEDPEFASNISSSTLLAWTNSDGSIYTLPDAQECIGYWYNEDIFRLAGLTDTGEPDGTVVLPKTWEDFWYACDAIAAIEPETGTAPMMLQLDQVRILLGARLASINNLSRDYMQKASAYCEMDDVLAASADLQRAVSYYDGDPLSVIDARQMFFDGKSAIYLNGVWANTELNQTTTEQNIKYAAFPSNDGSSISYINPPSGYVIGNTGSAEQIEASVRFVKYMMSEAVQRRIVAETGQAPSNPKLSAQWIESEVPILGQALNVCYSADVNLLSLYVIISDKDSSVIDAGISKLLQGGDPTTELVSILTES